MLKLCYNNLAHQKTKPNKLSVYMCKHEKAHQIEMSIMTKLNKK